MSTGLDLKHRCLKKMAATEIDMVQSEDLGLSSSDNDDT
jgi:hypothetical protein